MHKLENLVEQGLSNISEGEKNILEGTHVEPTNQMFCAYDVKILSGLQKLSKHLLVVLAEEMLTIRKCTINFKNFSPPARICHEEHAGGFFPALPYAYVIMYMLYTYTWTLKCHSVLIIL